MAIDSGDTEQQQVYDPNLGKERDAFPDEIIPDEQQKTLIRLMVQGEKEFRDIYDAVAATGQLNEVELNGILKAGKIRAEQKREEYLLAIRSNPANLISAVFKEFLQPFEGDVDRSLIGLDKKIAEIQQFVARERNADQIAAGRTVGSTSNYVARFLQNPGNDRLITFSKTSLTEPAIAEKIALGVLAEIGALPGNAANLEILFRTIERAGNPSGSSLPIASISPYSRIIRNLAASKPQFSQIKADIFLNNDAFNLSEFSLIAPATTWTRIIDIGGYVPYATTKT